MRQYAEEDTLSNAMEDFDGPVFTFDQRTYVINPKLSKGQKRLVERTLGNLDTLLETKWIKLG